jgi:opacity protein-like surface antigen
MNQLCACRSVSGILLLTALYGVFSAPPTRAEEDVRRATPSPGKALVFVFRIDPKPLPTLVPVIMNEVRVGELANGTFISTTIGPGRNYLRIGDRMPSTLEVAASQSYFVLVRSLGDPQSMRLEVQLVSEAEGRRLLAQSRFAGAAPATAAPPSKPSPAPVTTAPPPKPSPAPVTTAPPPKPSPAPVTTAPPPKPPPSPAATQPTVGREMSTPSEAGRDWNFALIAKAGTFKMANDNQMVAGLPSTFDTTSTSVYGVEAEWRGKGGIAVGGEVFHYNNDLVSAGTAQQEVFAILANGKYYFRLANWFYPFVGAGVGLANASYSNGLTGTASGLAFQALAGMEFRFNHIGVNVQYKYLDATTGNTDKEVKVGGSGILAGVSIAF